MKDFPLHHIAVRVFNLKDILQNRRLPRFWTGKFTAGRIRIRVQRPVGINLAEPLGRHRAVNIPPDLKAKDFPLHHIAVRVFNLKGILQNRRLPRFWGGDFAAGRRRIRVQHPVRNSRDYPLHIADRFSVAQQLDSEPFPRPHLAIPVFSLDDILQNRRLPQIGDRVSRGGRLRRRKGRVAGLRRVGRYPGQGAAVLGDDDFPALLRHPFQQRLQLGLKVRGGGRDWRWRVLVGGGHQNILCRRNGWDLWNYGVIVTHRAACRGFPDSRLRGNDGKGGGNDGRGLR